jgi:hypothetical protein
MTWNRRGIWAISKKETTIPLVFKSQIIAQISNLSNTKPSWFWAGHLIQCLTIPTIGLVRIEQKIDVSIKDSSLFIPEIFEPNYQLKFYKADWIDSLRLTIYEDSMPLNVTPDSIVFPNTVASSSTGTTVPVTATSVVLLAVNTSRKKYMIENNSNQDLYIDFAATTSVANHAQKIVKISAGGNITSYEDDGYTGVISGIWAAAGTGAALIREFV